MHTLYRVLCGEQQELLDDLASAPSTSSASLEASTPATRRSSASSLLWRSWGKGCRSHQGSGQNGQRKQRQQQQHARMT